MKRLLILFAALVSLPACKGELDYDISDAPTVPVVYAFWNTSEEDHIVCVTVSGAYNVSDIEDVVEVNCCVNRGDAIVSESSWTVRSESGMSARYYRIRTALQAGDNVRLNVNVRGNWIGASVVVPDSPTVTLDSSTIDSETATPPFKQYRFNLSVTEQSSLYYRLYSPAVYVEGWSVWNNRLQARREWPVGLKIDDSDPVFKNSSIQLPQFLSRYFTFVHTGLSNGTHIFTGDSFESGVHSFSFTMDQHDYLVFREEDHCLPENDYDRSAVDIYKYDVRFMLASMDEAEYRYMLAYNAYLTSYLDPFAEPVALPCNIEGGLGFFAIENAAVLDCSLEDCRYN